LQESLWQQAGEGLIIEKLPLNYLYVALFPEPLPNASSCDEAIACGQLLRDVPHTLWTGYPFSMTLTIGAAYYCAYDRLMGHWQSALGGRLHRVSYEEWLNNRTLWRI